MIVLGVLLAVLAVTGVFMYWTNYSSAASTTPPPALDARFTPLNVDNPALAHGYSEAFSGAGIQGRSPEHFQRDAASAPGAPPSKAPVNVAPGPPPGPPPLTVDAKYFGYVSDLGGSHRRAFFSTANNEDVIIAGEGDTFMGRFRVVRLTNTTADVEEVSSGRRATLTLEEPSPNG